MIGGITSTAMGTVGTIFSAIAGMKWDKQMSKLLEEDPAYTSDPYAKNRYGLSQTLLNARMPGAASRERNIASSGANTVNRYGRGATDASQFMAAAAAEQGLEGEQFNDLQDKEGVDYYNRLKMMDDASKGMSEDHKNLFDDSVRRWQDKINIKTAQYKARKQGGSDIGQLGSGLSGMGGGGMGGGGSTGQGGMTGMMGSMSDKRLKHNYFVVGKSPSGINIYEFSYLGSSDRYIGTMAQEVPQASFMTDSGYYAVDYSKIDVSFKRIS